MEPALSKKCHGKKFMWDGQSYETGEAALEAAETYKKEGFEIETVAEGDRYLVYTRRVSAVHSQN
ncbi:MAG: hypothetical protein M0Z81_13155 [Deltaproteobacteria bacterium]|jgi:hypothetical protein|nr:hypothetical protein [Deltaproteobacteria bacterium]